MNQRTSLHWIRGNLSEWETVSISKGISGRRLLKLEEEPLLVVAFRAEKKISDNYTRILKDIERVFEMEDTEEDVNSLFSDR